MYLIVSECGYYSHYVVTTDLEKCVPHSPHLGLLDGQGISSGEEPVR